MLAGTIQIDDAFGSVAARVVERGSIDCGCRTKVPTKEAILFGETEIRLGAVEQLVERQLAAAPDWQPGRLMVGLEPPGSVPPPIDGPDPALATFTRAFLDEPLDASRRLLQGAQGKPVEVGLRQSLALRLAIRPLWTSCRPLS